MNKLRISFSFNFIVFLIFSFSAQNLIAQRGFHSDYPKFEKEVVNRLMKKFDFSMPDIPSGSGVIQGSFSSIDFSQYFRDGNKVHVESDQNLQKFINRHKYLNERTETTMGFRVQIFTGGRRRSAENARAKFIGLYPDMYAGFDYIGTSYKVRVGDFLREEDAEKFSRELQLYFSQAIVVKDQVKVPKYRPEMEEGDNQENPFPLEDPRRN